ncbi:glycosyl transferase [Sagittula sp. NFXS13]|uniref:ATP-grasp fold amidoligase family protein n=1 Tax=Sagittula sp. NFXS13 TaxID=2819095 RepID=UPI0032DFBADF
MRLQNFIPTGHLWDNAISILNARKRLGYWPNPKRPQTFNEFILAQKWQFQGDIELARRTTDKAEIKTWLAEKKLDHLIVPTVGVFDTIEEIRGFSFEGTVIAKSTHGSGAAIIRTAQNGKAFSEADLKLFQSWLHEDYYIRSRENNYKDLPRRIIVEPMLKGEDGAPPKDYKIACINGEPFVIQVDIDRFGDHTRQLYTPDWTLLDFSMMYPRNPIKAEKPALLDEALETARSLAQGFGFLRVDFYFLSSALKLGELTYFPGNGAEIFVPPAADADLGAIIAATKAKNLRHGA